MAGEIPWAVSHAAAAAGRQARRRNDDPARFAPPVRGTSSLLLGRIQSLAPFAHKFGASPAWWVAFLVGAPASAAFAGALGTVISALSRDIRTSMQYTSFFIGLLSLGIGVVLVDGLSKGTPLQVAYAGGCIVATAVTLLLGARLISKDVIATCGFG